MLRGIVINLDGPVKRRKVMSPQREQKQCHDQNGEASGQPANAAGHICSFARVARVRHRKFKTPDTMLQQGSMPHKTFATAAYMLAGQWLRPLVSLGV